MILKKALIPLLFTILTVSAFSSITITRKTEAAGYPVISVSPRTSYASVGETVNVSIILSNAISVVGYQVHVSYFPELLSLISVTEGDLLKRGGAYTTFWSATRNDAEGIVRVVVSLLRGAQTVTGDGEAFKVSFNVKKAGGSELLLHHLMLTNEYGGQITPVFSQNGTVTTARLDLNPSVMRSGGAEDYSINKTFNVNVTLNGEVNNLYKYYLNINYGNGVLEATSIDLLPLMGTPNTNQTEMDHDNGHIRLSLNCTPPAPATNATGTLATITFRVLSFGSTEIEISENSSLVDVNEKQAYPLFSFASFNNEYSPSNIGILSSTLSSYNVTAEENITLTALIRNEGATSETCYIMAHAQNTVSVLVAQPTNFSIDANTSQTTTITLRTDGLDGNYSVTVFLFYLPEETTYGDNQFTVNQQLTVTPKAEEASSAFSPTFYYAIAIILVLIVIAATYYLIRRRRKP